MVILQPHFAGLHLETDDRQVINDIPQRITRL